MATVKKKKKPRRPYRRKPLGKVNFPVLTPEQLAARERAVKVLRPWFAQGCPKNFDWRACLVESDTPLFDELKYDDVDVSGT